MSKLNVKKFNVAKYVHENYKYIIQHIIRTEFWDNYLFTNEGITIDTESSTESYGVLYIHYTVKHIRISSLDCSNLARVDEIEKFKDKYMNEYKDLQEELNKVELQTKTKKKGKI